MNYSGSNTWDWGNTTPSFTPITTTTIDGEPAIFCPEKGGYIPSRCCPHFCENKTQIMVRWKTIVKPSKLGAKVMFR